MSSERLRALWPILAPSGLLLAVAIVGLFLGSYWQYVMAISLGAAVVGGALAMLVGYARCITLATGAMLAIGAYGAAFAGGASGRAVPRRVGVRDSGWAQRLGWSWRYRASGFAATISRWSPSFSRRW